MTTSNEISIISKKILILSQARISRNRFREIWNKEFACIFIIYKSYAIIFAYKEYEI